MHTIAELHQLGRCVLLYRLWRNGHRAGVRHAGRRQHLVEHAAAFGAGLRESSYCSSSYSTCGSSYCTPNLWINCSCWLEEWEDIGWKIRLKTAEAVLGHRSKNGAAKQGFGWFWSSEDTTTTRTTTTEPISSTYSTSSTST